MKINILNLLNTGDKAFVVSQTILGDDPNYSPIVITRKNKSSIYFKYDRDSQDDFEWRASKEGVVETTVFGYYREILLDEQDVKEHKNRVKDRKLRQMKREYIKNHVSDFSDDEVDRLYDLLKG